MAKKEKANYLDNSHHVFNPRFAWVMPCPLVNFYLSAQMFPFIYPLKKIKVHIFFSGDEMGKLYVNG